MLRAYIVLILSLWVSSCFAANTTHNGIIEGVFYTKIKVHNKTAENNVSKPIPFNPNELPGKTLIYYFGNETPRDILVAQSSGNFSDSIPLSYNINLSYPMPEHTRRAAKVTCVRADIETTSDVAHAKIISGGIGQKNFKIYLDGLNTYRFAYTVYVYSSGHQVKLPFPSFMVGGLLGLVHILRKVY